MLSLPGVLEIGQAIKCMFNFKCLAN